MLDTREAAMMEANDFQDSLGVLLSSEKCDIPLTITHSIFTSWAAANSPTCISKRNKKKNRTHNMSFLDTKGIMLQKYYCSCHERHCTSWLMCAKL